MRVLLVDVFFGARLIGSHTVGLQVRSGNWTS